MKTDNKSQTAETAVRDLPAAAIIMAKPGATWQHCWQCWWLIIISPAGDTVIKSHSKKVKNSMM